MLQNVTTAYNIKNWEKLMPKELNDDSKENDDIPTTEMMYFLTKSFKRDSRALTAATGALICLVAMMVMFTFLFYATMDNYGTITQVDEVDCSGIMYEMACYVFEPHEGIIPEEVISEMYQSRDAMTVWIWIALIVLTPTLLFTYLKLRSTRNEMQGVADEYIRDSYFLNMELANPEGRNKAEKIFNLLKSVFPEVRLLSGDTPFEELELKTEVSGYEFEIDLDFPLNQGHLGVIFFDKLTYEELKKFAKKVKDKFDKENDRIICIAKEFGAEFTDLKAENEVDYSDELEEKMDELDTVGHIDLVKEEESGYSIMWID